MLYYKFKNNRDAMLAMGQISLCLGILLSRAVGGYWLPKLFHESSPLHFFQGLLDGLSVALIIFSIVCSVRYYKLRKGFKSALKAGGE